MKTRIVVVGAAWYGDWAKNFYKACARLGFPTEIVYNNSAPAPLGGNNDAVTSLFEKTKRFLKGLSPSLFRFLKVWRRRLSEYEIISRVGSVDPARERVIVIFTWTPGTSWVLKKLKRKQGVTLVLWLGEPPHTREMVGNYLRLFRPSFYRGRRIMDGRITRKAPRTRKAFTAIV